MEKLKARCVEFRPEPKCIMYTVLAKISSYLAKNFIVLANGQYRQYLSNKTRQISLIFGMFWPARIVGQKRLARIDLARTSKYHVL